MYNQSSVQTSIDDLQDVEWMGREIRVYKAVQRDRLHKKDRSYH
tara:strand:- start:212 stop:343 length:132 start_codon:yes stop_codon:yes gene_type:complete